MTQHTQKSVNQNWLTPEHRRRSKSYEPTEADLVQAEILKDEILQEVASIPEEEREAVRGTMVVRLRPGNFAESFVGREVQELGNALVVVMNIQPTPQDYEKEAYVLRGFGLDLQDGVVTVTNRLAFDLKLPRFDAARNVSLASFGLETIRRWKRRVRKVVGISKTMPLPRVLVGVAKDTEIPYVETPYLRQLATRALRPNTKLRLPGLYAPQGGEVVGVHSNGSFHEVLIQPPAEQSEMHVPDAPSPAEPGTDPGVYSVTVDELPVAISVYLPSAVRLCVLEGSYVEQGDPLGSIASPIYYHDWEHLTRDYSLDFQQWLLWETFQAAEEPKDHPNLRTHGDVRFFDHRLIVPLLKAGRITPVRLLEDLRALLGVRFYNPVHAKRKLWADRRDPDAIGKAVKALTKHLPIAPQYFSYEDLQTAVTLPSKPLIASGLCPTFVVSLEKATLQESMTLHGQDLELDLFSVKAEWAKRFTPAAAPIPTPSVDQIQIAFDRAYAEAGGKPEFAERFLLHIGEQGVSLESKVSGTLRLLANNPDSSAAEQLVAQLKG